MPWVWDCLPEGGRDDGGCDGDDDDSDDDDDYYYNYYNISNIDYYRLGCIMAVMATVVMCRVRSRARTTASALVKERYINGFFF